MKVSVIITCYNYGRFLNESIESVLNQTYKNDEIEIIIVNDGSTDNTNEIAKLYPVKIINQTNQGLPIARNIGISFSKGRYILPLDADDKLHPTYLEKTVPILENTSDIGVVYTHRCHFGLIQTKKYAKSFDLEELKEKCFINYCSLFRKELWSECGGYNTKMILGYEDWDFWLNIAKRNWRFELVDEVLFFYRKHGISLIDIAKSNHAELVKIIYENHPEIFGKITE